MHSLDSKNIGSLKDSVKFKQVHLTEVSKNFTKSHPLPRSLISGWFTSPIVFDHILFKVNCAYNKSPRIIWMILVMI